MKLLVFVLPTAFLASSAISGPVEDWANWRGPEGTGWVADADPPSTFGEDANLRWKVEIPGEGHASPIVLGDRIYVSTSVKGEAAEAVSEPRFPGILPPTNKYGFHVLCLDRASGRTIWNKRVHEEVPFEGVHPSTGYASISPVTDGEHVYASFGSYGIYCLDLDGNVVWQKDLGQMKILRTFGEGASPALHDKYLVVPWDHEGDSFVAVLNKSDGSELWRRDRNEMTNWATPVVTEVNGRTQVLLSGLRSCIAYDLENGDEIWSVAGMTSNAIPTPIVGHGLAYFMTGFQRSAMVAVRLSEATGDVTDTDAVVWSNNRGAPYVPSAMLAGQRLYFLRGSNSVISCFNAIDGTPHYLGERLEIGDVYASIVGGGDRLYVCSRSGSVAVIRDGEAFELISINKLDEGINATPAIAGAELFIRGNQHLYCFASEEAE